MKDLQKLFKKDVSRHGHPAESRRLAYLHKSRALVPTYRLGGNETAYLQNWVCSYLNRILYVVVTLPQSFFVGQGRSSLPAALTRIINAANRVLFLFHGHILHVEVG